MKYLKFKSPWDYNDKKKSFVEKIILYLGLSANPDYDNKIYNVEFWLVEFDEEDIPIREIGLDNNSKDILKMPYKKNYGYWTDNNLVYQDFISDFASVKIEKKEFEEKWKAIS
ncbi:hypothetical protein [Riemerella anatipestifer]|uniref:hypothetical protein n=1 Tax=Riemerella anatipestifer TaxID=34085 RepID=UPI00069B39C1|nr:hypothetical protein [Riemerella anatipestifer]